MSFILLLLVISSSSSNSSGGAGKLVSVIASAKLVIFRCNYVTGCDEVAEAAADCVSNMHTSYNCYFHGIKL